MVHRAVSYASQSNKISFKSGNLNPETKLFTNDNAKIFLYSFLVHKYQLVKVTLTLWPISCNFLKIIGSHERYCTQVYERASRFSDKFCYNTAAHI